MTNATATFQDIYFGATEMKLASFKTSHRGARVVRFRWMPVAAEGCITTGFASCGFPSEGRAIEAAQRNVRFSNVAPV